MAEGHHAVCERTGDTWVARFRGREIARTGTPVVLREFAGRAFPPVIYFPPGDVAMDLLTRSERTSHCPIKGQARYFSLGGEDGGDIAWTYEEPLEDVAAIRGHLAFYPDRVEVVREE